MPSERSSHLKEMIKDTFKIVDADHSGYLEKHQLENVLARITAYLGVEIPSQEDVDFIMKELDKNGDGKLSKDEFAVLVDEVIEALQSKN